MPPQPTITSIVLTAEVVDLLEALVRETKEDSCGQPVAVDEVGLGVNHNNAQRDYVADTGYRLAVEIRKQRGES